MSNKKFGLDERASGKIVTITTGLGRYAQQKRITFPTFAKGQGLNAWADYEITGAIQKGVPIDGHFVETTGNEGQLQNYVVASQLQSANVKKGKHYAFHTTGKARAIPAAAKSDNPVVTLIQEFGNEEGLKFATASLRDLKKGDYYKKALAVLGLPETTTAEEFKLKITAA